MTIKNDDARRAYNIHGVKPTTSEKVLNCKQNKIIDADAEQAYAAALKLAEMKADARTAAPVIVADEVYA